MPTKYLEEGVSAWAYVPLNIVEGEIPLTEEPASYSSWCCKESDMTEYNR